MSRYQLLIRDVLSKLDFQQRAYGDWPLGISKDFGSEEVAEAIAHIAILEQSKAKAEEWDGDATDDIWREQKNIARLLSSIDHKYVPEISRGLSHQERSVRFWIAWLIGETPCKEFIQPLDRALGCENDELCQKMYRAALEKCKKT
jgi:hypothetical protein